MFYIFLIIIIILIIICFYYKKNIGLISKKIYKKINFKPIYFSKYIVI